MDSTKIELIIKLQPPLIEDPYRDSVVAILTPPKWYHPVARYRYWRTFKLRVHVVMAEYAVGLLDAIETKPQTISNTKVPFKRDRAAESEGRTYATPPPPTAPTAP